MAIAVINPSSSAGGETPIALMPLEIICKRYEMETVIAFPIGGYGWRRFETKECDVPIGIEPPRRFHLCIQQFHLVDDTIEGGCGRIEESNHLFDGLGVSFWLRDRLGEVFFNLTTNPGNFDLWIGNGIPSAEKKYLLPSPLRAQFAAPPVFQGTACVGLSLDSLKKARPWIFPEEELL